MGQMSGNAANVACSMISIINTKKFNVVLEKSILRSVKTSLKSTPLVGHTLLTQPLCHRVLREHLGSGVISISKFGFVSVFDTQLCSNPVFWLY
jgi:hypothetical protein